MSLSPSDAACTGGEATRKGLLFRLLPFVIRTVLIKELIKTKANEIDTIFIALLLDVEILIDDEQDGEDFEDNDNDPPRSFRNAISLVKILTKRIVIFRQ